MKKQFLITFLFFATLAKSQESKSYSFNLQQAIEHALQYNYTAINAGRDIESSKQKKWETTANGLPQINGTVGYQRNFVIQRAVFGDSEIPLGANHSMNGAVTLSQLIFDGSYIVALQASKAYLDYFVTAKKKTDTEIREMIINSYGSVLLAEESIKILESNKLILEKNYTDANQIFKNGLGEEESVEQISITLASVKSSLNNVIRLKEISLNMLKINLGLEINDALKLTDNLDDLSKSNLESAFLKTEFNVNNSIDYEVVSSLVTQKRLLLKLEKSKALPSIGAAANFGYNAFGDTFSMFSSNQRWFNYSNIGVNLNIPLFSSFSRSAKTQQAKIAFEQSQTQQKEVEQKIKLSYEKSKSDFEFSIEQYNTAKSNLNLAERIEKKQQIKFKEGLSTSFEFSEAQRQLYAAQQNYLQSMVDIINKKAALEKITNKQ